MGYSLGSCHTEGHFRSWDKYCASYDYKNKYCSSFGILLRLGNLLVVDGMRASYLNSLASKVTLA